MDIKGDLKIHRQSLYYSDNLVSLDFPRILNDTERDLIPDPAHGDLIVTIDDHSLNIYDDDVKFWKKLKSNHVMDRGILSLSLNAKSSISTLNISTLGSVETNFAGLSHNREYGTMLSNGSGDIGFLCGGQSSNTGIITTFSGSTSAVNIVEWIQISTALCADMFGELPLSSNSNIGTSNAELNTAIIGGFTTTSRNFTKFNMQSKVDANFEILTNAFMTGYGMRPFATSNYTLDRAVFGGGYATVGTDDISYISISSGISSEVFGLLTVNAVYPNACSNGELNRAVINLGLTNLGIDYIDISTLGNAQSFGNLTVLRRITQPCSNRTRNRAIFPCSHELVTTVDYLDISTLGNAQIFDDLDVSLGAVSSCSNS